MFDTRHSVANCEHWSATVARCLSIPPTVDVDTWANKHRELSKIANKRGGRWRSRCYQREIQAECTNPDVRSVVFVAAAQTGGKSEIILNFVGRQIHLNPGPIMLVQPTNELAERFSKKRVQPMLRDTQVLAGLVSEQKSRNASNTIRQKEFPGGALNIAGANTPNELCSDPIRDIIIDEVDRCDAAAGNEGDIVTLAEARQESFEESAFSLFTSTPSGAKPRPLGEDQPAKVSKILMLFAESDQRHWFCPCKKCGHMQTLRWENVDFSKVGTREDPRLLCEKEECRYPHTDPERVEMIERGEWRATAPFNGRRGYFLPGIYSLSRHQRGCNSKLHQMVRDFLRAKRRGTEALRAWVNTFLCECFTEDSAESVDGGELFRRRERYGGMIPDGVVFITNGTDVHPDRIESHTIGWGENEEAWVLDYGVFLGDTKKQGSWLALDRFLLQTYEHPLYGDMKVERAAIDTGHSTDEAYDFCQQRVFRGVIAIKGIQGIGAPLMNPPRKSGVKKVRLWLVAKNTGVKTIYARLKGTEPGQGFFHFPNDREPLFDADYFKQLTAADVLTVKKQGQTVQIFDPGGRRDEPLDTAVYALAALRQRPIDFGKLAKRLLALAELSKATKPEAPEPPAKPKPPRRNFANAWRKF